MIFTVKNLVLLGLYTGVVIYVSHLFTAEKESTKVLQNDQTEVEKSIVVEEPIVYEEKEGGLEIDSALSFIPKIFHNKKPSHKEFLDKFIASEDADYESWEFRRELQKLALKDWPAAQKYIDHIPNQGLKNKMILNVIKSVGVTNPDLAMSIAKESSNQTLRKKRIGEACEAIAKKNPEYVAEVFIKNGMKSIGDYRVFEFTADYARHDFEKARSFIDSIEDPVIWESAFTQYMYMWGKKDPKAAADYAIAQDTTAAFTGPLWVMGQQLAEKDIDSALEYAMSKPVNQNTSDLLTGVYMGWAKIDVHAAAAKIVSMPTDRIHLGGYEVVAREFAKVDPEEAQKWLLKIKTHEYKRNSTNRFIKQWVSTDPDAAAAYVDSLNAGEIKDYAIYPIIRAFHDVKPEYAIKWARTINHKGGQHNWTKFVYDKWKRQDPKKAKAWLDQTDLIPKEAKAKVDQ